MKIVLQDDVLRGPNIRQHIRSNAKYCPDIASYLTKLKAKNVQLYISLNYDMISDELLRFVVTCESLTHLELGFCSLPSTLPWPLILSSCLRKLYLRVIRVDTLMIEELLANCKAIESLSFMYCDSLKYLKLHGIPKLKELFLFYNCNLERVEIDEAPNFQLLDFSRDDDNKLDTSLIMSTVNLEEEELLSYEPERVVVQLSYLKELTLISSDMLALNALCLSRLERLTIICRKKKLDLLRLDSCKSLIHLTFSSYCTNDHWLNDNLSKLENLKVLQIRNCLELRHIKIPLKHLTTLSITQCNKLESIDMDCPNLSKFSYHAVERYVSHLGGWSITSVPTCVELTCSYRGVEHDKLLALLKKIGNSKYLILRNLTIQDVMTLMEIRQRSHSLPLFQVRRLKLSLRAPCVQPGPRLGVIMDAILWSCPQLQQIHITSLVGLRIYNVTIRLEYKEPTELNGSNCSCYASLPIDCWKHSVKNVLIEQKEGFKDDDSMEKLINNVLQ